MIDRGQNVGRRSTQTLRVRFSLPTMMLTCSSLYSSLRCKTLHMNITGEEYIIFLMSQRRRFLNSMRCIINFSRCKCNLLKRKMSRKKIGNPRIKKLLNLLYKLKVRVDSDAHCAE